MGLFKSLFGKKKKQHKILSWVDELYLELEEIQLKKERTEHYLEELNIKEATYEEYEKLDSESITQITTLAQRAKALEEKKEELRGRLISNNAALTKVSQHEKHIPEWLKAMQETERRHKETQIHIDYLQEEQMDLEEERDVLLDEYKLLKGISFAFIVFLGVSLLVSFVLLHVLREKIWLVLSGLVVIMFFFIIVLILSKEKLEKELKQNEILQQKAVRYLNQSTVRLYNQTKYLEYMYRKLGVDSTSKLEVYYASYLKNKNNERAYLRINEKINDIEEDILTILHKRDILRKDIGNITDWILSPTLLDEIKKLHDEKKKTEEQLNALIDYEGKLKKEIEILQDAELGAS